MSNLFRFAAVAIVVLAVGSLGVARGCLPERSTWEQIVVAGQPGFVDPCGGFLEVVVAAHGRAHLRDLKRGDRALLDAMLGTLAFAPTATIDTPWELAPGARHGQSGNASGPRSASSEACRAWSSAGSQLYG
jgi:hypothetical protein